ncbi:MAG: DUF3150 domain-containing protein [Pseudomonadota bacterium]|nr:DUF3150 domain-containing protein [Pseudomonadota bacterium]
MSNTVKHLENLCVIHVDFDIWSGQTRLSPDDFKLGEGGKIPSEKVAQLGSKKICDPAKLKGFHRLKTETRRLLLRHGMPFMNGFAVPASKTDTICDELNKISAEYESLKQDFVSGYNNAVEEWILENPEYESTIRAGALPKSAVEKRIGFEYQIFMIQPISDDDPTAESLNRKIESLGGDLLDEVTEEAQNFFSKNLSGREECSIATRNTLKKIRDKVDGLSFLDSSFIPLVNLLDETLRGYEQHAHGRFIRAPFFYQVVAATLIMGDRKRLQEYAEGAVTLAGMAETVTPGHSRNDSNSSDDTTAQTQPEGDSNEADGDVPYEPLSSDERQEMVVNTELETAQPEESLSDDNPTISETSQEDLEADMDRFFEQFSSSDEAQASEQAVAEESETHPETVEVAQPVAVEPETHPVMPETEEEEDFFF